MSSSAGPSREGHGLGIVNHPPHNEELGDTGVSVRFSITKFRFISIQASTFLSQFLYLSSL